MYVIALRRSVERKFQHLARKDLVHPGIIHRKIEKTLSDPHRYKNLRQPLQHLKRVHVGKRVVLVFSVDEEEHLVIIEDYDHHDNIYRR